MPRNKRPNLCIQPHENIYTLVRGRAFEHAQTLRIQTNALDRQCPGLVRNYEVLNFFNHAILQEIDCEMNSTWYPVPVLICYRKAMGIGELGLLCDLLPPN